MPHSIFRERLLNKIRYAIEEAGAIAHVDHAGLRGRFRELVSSELLLPMLPQGYSIGGGKICDHLGGLSSEADLVIYNASVLPPIMYSAHDGVFPLEACFYSIEVKSRLTAEEVKDAYAKGKTLLTLCSPLTQPVGDGTFQYPVVLTLFAFDSDLSGNGKSELERYAEVDPNWLVNPTLRAICVVGKGYWYFNSQPRQWHFHPATTGGDEVVDFVAGVSNTLAKARFNTRVGLLGQYVMDERDIKFIRGHSSDPE